MRYNLTTPCEECPFLQSQKHGYTMKRLREFASGEFPCHKACKVEEAADGGGGAYIPRNDKTPHCAGALIFLEKRNQPHQMMRISERLGMYDASSLNMDADVR